MKNFHPLTVRAVHKETPDAVCVSFDVPSDLAEAFAYTQGQHLTLRRDQDGEEIRRNYSICTSVRDRDLTVVIRHVPDGAFSSYANEHLKPGDVVEVMPPAGRFYAALDPENEKHYAAFAAGAGITPIMSIIKTTLEEEPKSRFTLFFGNRDAQSTIFRAQISELKNRYMDRFSFYHFLSRAELEIPFFHGRLDGEKVGQILDRLLPVAAIDEAFICGPDTMIRDVRDALTARGLDRKHIHFERFVSPSQAAAISQARDKKTVTATSGAQIRAILDGNAHDFAFANGVATVLEAAEAAGLEVPYSCRGGVCTTCRAKVIEGEAEMAINYGLEEDEIKAGFVLTCQAVPKSDRLVISYDE